MGEASAAAVRVANDELATIRDAMRELNRMVDALERGELDKVVLTQRNRMRAVLVSFDRFAELEWHASAGTLPPIRLRASGGGS